MKRGLIISLVVFLSLSLGGCGIGSLDKEATEDSVSVLSSDESKGDSLKLSDILNRITGNNEANKIIKEENEIVKDGIVSNEENTVSSDDKEDVKKTEENLTDEAHIQKAKKEILKYATYLKEDLIYEDFVNINNHISGMDEEVNALRGVKMYHFVQDKEHSPHEFYYNSNTGHVFVGIQSLIFRLNDYKHINPNECGIEFIYTLSKINGDVTLENAIYDEVLDPNGDSDQIINKEENKDVNEGVYTEDENIGIARSAILKHATYLQEDVSFIDIKTIDGFIYKDEEASNLLGVKMYHFEQNTEYSPDEFYYNANTGEVFVAKQGILFRLNDYKQMNPNTFGESYDIN